MVALIYDKAQEGAKPAPPSTGIDLEDLILREYVSNAGLESLLIFALNEKYNL